MKVMGRKFWGPLALFAGLLACGSAAATTIPSGWSCDGNCGTNGADGIVTAPPNGQTSYQWISTWSGNDGVGVLPSGGLSGEVNGSTLATSAFSADAGTSLNFYFNYVTSDGGDYSDYAWAALFNEDGTLNALLFTARTAPSGSIVPGFGMPAVNPGVTLNPSSVDIIGGGPNWSPLGSDSGECWSTGCGYTGWVNANYTIATAGNYYLQIGVINWSDSGYDSGLAMSGVTVGGAPINGVPEPAALGMFGLGALLVGLFAGLRRRVPQI
jgi:hypothetical protein